MTKTTDSPKETIERAWAYHDYTTIAAGVLSNRIATLALQPDLRERIRSRSRKYLSDNVDALTAWVEKHSGLFSFIPPRAGGMAFLRYNMEINSTELATRLRQDKSVFIIAGDCFGMDRYIRIGIGPERDYLLAGLDLIDEGLREIGK